ADAWLPDTLPEILSLPVPPPVVTLLLNLPLLLSGASPSSFTLKLLNEPSAHFSLTWNFSWPLLALCGAPMLFELTLKEILPLANLEHEPFLNLTQNLASVFPAYLPVFQLVAATATVAVATSTETTRMAVRIMRI